MQQARRQPDRDQTSPASGRQGRGSALLVTVLALVSLLPFLDRAFRADDPLLVWAGDQIRSEPLDFYGAEVSWTNGRWVPMHEVVRNPPLTPYFIAAVRALFGETEVALHLAFLLPALLALLGTRRLAQEHGAPPTLAALATLFTPAFLVSATTVTYDVMLLAFWVWSMVWWERGLRTDHGPTLVAASWLAGLAFLCGGYVGLGLISLLLVVGLARRGRPGRWMLPLLIPLGIAVGYEAAIAELYDMTDAVFAAPKSRFRDLERLGGAASLALVFVGGSLLGVAFWLHALWSRRVWVSALALTLAAGVFVSGGDAAPVQRLVFGAAGVMILALVASEARHRPDATSLLLGLWIFGAFASATWLNRTVAARSVLPIAPAVAILLARRVGAEARHWPLVPAAYWPLVPAAYWPLVPAACVALAVAWADYAQADATRWLAREVVSNRVGPAAGRLWVRADGGLKYYLMREGGQPFGTSNQALVPGDELVAEDEPWTRPALTERLVRQDPTVARGPAWLATLDAKLGAGFYAASDARGQAPFPFALGPTSPRVLHRMLVVPGRSRREAGDDVAESSPARHLVLISVDALRADHLGAYGSELGITPALDALAEQSQRFTTCYATSPASLPSLASLLTGRYPDEIGMLDELGVLPADTRTLAMFLRANGFRTGAVVSNPVLAPRTGLHAGFEQFDVVPPEWEPRERVAPETTEAALAMLDVLAEADTRLFLWVHYRDPHGPYTPPAPLRERVLEGERARSDGQRALQVSPDRRGLGAIPSYQYQPPERTVAWYRAGYAGEVAYLDRAVSRLLAGLDERGLSESSLIVFTADHGESMGEHDYWFAHGETLDESALRVPLLIRAPGRGGSLRREVASLVDVLPTVASLLGLVLDPPLSGFDLREPLPGRSVYFTTGRGAARRRDGIVQVPYKLVRARAMEGAQEELLLSRLSDPERATTAARPGRLRSLLLQLNGRSESLREADARAVD